MHTFNFKISRKSINFIFCVLLYRICLDIVYRQCISPQWEYYGLAYDSTPLCTFISWAILIPFIFLVISFIDRLNTFISTLAILFFFLRFVPLTSLLACKEQELNFILWECIYWFLVFFLLRIGKNIHLPQNVYKNDKILLWITIIFVCTVIFISGYYAHFRLNFGLGNVYDLRAEARDFNIPTILAYLWAPTGNILPIILISFLQKRKLILALLIVFIIFLNFSINGSKSNLFKLFFCLFLYFFMRKNFLNIIPCLFVLLVAISLSEWWLNDSTFISTLVLRRVLFVPVLLDSYYFDYITEYGPTYFYKLNSTDLNFIIGDEFFGDSETRANNGMFTDAFMNLGYLGCFVYPFVYAFLFRLCSSAFKGVNNQILFFASLLIVTTLGSTILTTALLTHGIFLLCLVLYFLPREESNFEPKTV